MPWYKFEKFYQGGSHFDYRFLKPREGKIKVGKNQLEDEMQDWGDRTAGGHNYGFRVYAKYVKKVPLRFLRGKLESAKQRLDILPSIHFEQTKEAEERVKFFEGELKKRTRKK